MGFGMKKLLQYVTWMLARCRANQPTPEPRSFPPLATICGGGQHGRGVSVTEFISRKRSSGDAALYEKDDTKDTTSSP
jgi:hypothetical protein